MSHHTLDATRLLCPLPVIRAQNFIATLNPGDTVDVTCTDPAAKNDIPAWSIINGHEIICRKDHNNTIVLTVNVMRNRYLHT